jgi:hypothetical protein
MASKELRRYRPERTPMWQTSRAMRPPAASVVLFVVILLQRAAVAVGGRHRESDPIIARDPEEAEHQGVP